MKHLAAVGISFWSHSRGLLSLLANLVLIGSDLTVTLFIPSVLQEKVERLYNEEYDLSKEQLERLRVVYIDTSQVVDEKGDQGIWFVSAQTVIDRYYDDIMAGRSIGTFEALAPPTAWLADMLAHQILDFALESGFKGERILWEATEPLATYILHEWFRMMSNTTKAGLIPLEQGVKPLNNYEIRPARTVTEQTASPLDIPPMFRYYHQSTLKGHRMLCAFSRQLVPQGNELLQEHCFDKLTIIDAQYSARFWNQTPTFPSDPLFDWLAKQKKQSVVFISFSSLLFPAVLVWQLDVLVDSLISAGLPFVLCLGAVQASKIKEADQPLFSRIKAKVLDSGSIHVGFINQPLAIKHPAIGWALIHSGASSLTEVLVSGITSIHWPFAYDQPLNASTVVDTLDAGFEVMEHRDKLVGLLLAGRGDYRIKCTPESLRAELDGIWQQAKGPVGERKRRNAEKAGKLLREEHALHGEAYLREVLALV